MDEIYAIFLDELVELPSMADLEQLADSFSEVYGKEIGNRLFEMYCDENEID